MTTDSPQTFLLAAQTDQLYREVASRIREVRELKGMSQEKIASSVGLSRTSLTNIEHGKQKFLLHTFIGIASALGVSPMELLPIAQSNPLTFNLKLPSDQAQRDFVQRALNPLIPHEPKSQNPHSIQSKRVARAKSGSRSTSKR